MIGAGYAYASQKRKAMIDVAISRNLDHMRPRIVVISRSVNGRPFSYQCSNQYGFGDGRTERQAYERWRAMARETLQNRESW